MGFPNTKGSEQFAILGRTGPINANAAQTAWVPVSNVHRLLALLDTGANANGVLNAQLMQALDATGTGAKPITGVNGQAKALTPITAGNAINVQALIDCSVDELDTNNGYAFVQLQITLSNAGLIAGLLQGINPRFEPASSLNATSVAQITG
ncbi:hypothetical protein [Ralstonia solanacearum]|uniref:hypothetical protein n=1 Tax=Ralstonia solanacearum TaxID=305 RepID=UPI0005ABF9BB|nr:hypothetical protein [Ralstonia solanacearum]MCL9826631.1 hypothetical protein [Ralstonia solanacearum]MCL9831419.1 hypothetical protein [Ralstonia solanacearum]MCL9836200.1 hypothetical protein [Ralstonia solanacearum]OAI71506.1 hypothetical protein RSP797_12130 [Ralstonia solanacearum]